VEERAVRALERLADANEAIVALASEQRAEMQEVPSVGPAICPHCREFDPQVAIEAGEGNFADMVVVAHCRNCGSRFFGVPQGWLCFVLAEAALAEIHARRET